MPPRSAQAQDDHFRHQQAADVRKLRNGILALGALSDEEVESLYSYYSEISRSAVWLAGPDVEGFRFWVTRSPLQIALLKKSEASHASS